MILFLYRWLFKHMLTSRKITSDYSQNAVQTRFCCLHESFRCNWDSQAFCTIRYHVINFARTVTSTWTLSPPDVDTRSSCSHYLLEYADPRIRPTATPPPSIATPPLLLRSPILFALGIPTQGWKLNGISSRNLQFIAVDT